MTSTDLVGPIRVMRMRDGTLLTVEVPQNTLDPRYMLCSQHHVGCDCYEAERNENTNEYRSMYFGACDAVKEVLAGHHTFADTYRDDGRMVAGRWVSEWVWDETAVCMCTGCQIARKAYLQ